MKQKVKTKTKKQLVSCDDLGLGLKSSDANNPWIWNSYLSKNEYTQRRLTFGKYFGTQIKDIPMEYLKWGILNLNIEWATMFSRELQRREPKWK